MKRQSATEIESTAEDWIAEVLPIPSHWVYADFETAFENISLTGLKIPQKKYSPSGIFPVVDQGSELIGGYTNDAEKRLKLKRASIVFGDHTKCFKYVSFPFAPGADGVKVLVPREPIVERFAYYGCKSLRLPDRGYSRHYSFLKKSRFPLAPAAEQHRIVAKIEALFSELDKGVESLKTAREQLKVYRQAVLKHAFEGKLTAQWREENADKLETPEQLLARIRKEREARYQQQLTDWRAVVKVWEAKGKEGKKPGKPKTPSSFAPFSAKERFNLAALPLGWTYIRLGELVDEPKYGTSKKCAYDIDGTGVLRIPNVARGVVDSTDLKFALFDDNELEVYALKNGDILTIRSNGSVSLVGKCALVSGKEEEFIYAGYLIRIRPNQELVSSEYILSVLSCHDLRAQIEGKAKSTSGVNNINSGELQHLIVSLCCRDEQTELMTRLSSTLSSIDATESEIEKQLLRSKTLRQSILKKAFSGQLVPQDPNDEPASVLLERIKAKKAQQKPKPRKKQGKRKATAG